MDPLHKRVQTALQRSARGLLNVGEGGDGGQLGDASLARLSPLTSWTSMEMTRRVCAAPHNVTRAELEPREHLKPEPSRLHTRTCQNPLSYRPKDEQQKHVGTVGSPWIPRETTILR